MTRIAALGSSFAAGPGIDPVADLDTGRSAHNYPSLLAAALGAELVDLTVSGATTATILSEPQLTMTGATVPPQLDGLPADVELVTVTAGGNDLGYIASMLFPAAQRLDPDGVVMQMARALGQLPERAPDTGEAEIAAAASGLARVVAAVHERAPGARVLLVDYLTLLGPDAAGSPEAPFTPEETAAATRIREALEEAYRRAARQSGAELVEVSTASRGHGIGSAEPWVSGYLPEPTRVVGSFHPNAAGMRAVADLVARALAEPRP